MEIVEAGLQVLENDVIGPVTIESIRLMKNQISSIEEDAFRYGHLWFWRPQISSFDSEHVSTLRFSVSWEGQGSIENKLG